MKIAITGATGFIGHHVRNILKLTDNEVLLVTRDARKVSTLFTNESVLLANIDEFDQEWFSKFGEPDAVLHLAWGGLPNYLSQHHILVELPMQIRFLTSLIESGLKKLVVTGTCYEYGSLMGELSEHHETMPTTQYGIAKNNLRKILFELQQSKNYELAWARIFFPYGEGQSKTSLYSQLHTAVRNGENEFPINSGKQILDFIQVEEVARVLVRLLDQSSNIGVINIGSGNPKSVYEFVHQQIYKNGWSIIPKIGLKSVRDYESPSFWADITKMRVIFERDLWI